MPGCFALEATYMIRITLVRCCVWLLGCGIAVTALMAGLDHWGSYQRFYRRGRPRAEMPLDAIAFAPFSDAMSPHRGALCICSHCVDHDDYAGDEPDEPHGDRLILWLCDDDGVGKQWALAISPGDGEWTPLAIQADTPPLDDFSPSPHSLNSLHVRLQI